jgi:SAM-dependent methyltransferase
MAELTLYDEIPYESFPHPACHPDQLATVAFLHGLSPPSPADCRMLELGCGSGENLLGIAYALRGSRLVGIDLARTPIERARDTAAALDLANIEFRVTDVRDLASRGLGEFDFVVAHGLYSWVDHDTRDAVLAACEQHLAPNGIAYVSFNTHPGGHFRRGLRELAFWYARGTSDRAAVASRARELFTGLVELRRDSDAWGALLHSELPDLSIAPTSFLTHDLLGDDWEPVWFADFAAAAARHGLQYVGEGSFHRVSGPWEPQVEEGLRRLADGDRVAYEQIVDFMVWRRFRDSLLCRSGPAVRDRVDLNRLTDLHFRPAGPLGGLAGEPDAILVALAEHAPHAVSFAALRSVLGAETMELAGSLLDGARRGGITMHLRRPALGGASGERPQISALARLEAATDRRYCTTLLGGVVKLEGPVIRSLIGLADGLRDREQIRLDLAAAGAPLLEPEQFDTALRELAAMALIESS